LKIVFFNDRGPRLLRDDVTFELDFSSSSSAY
jgi:hypothetical protein